MADFLLVHGAWHGSWCWQKLVPILEQDGHRVLLADLPGNGHNDIDPASVTLSIYADYLAGLLAAAKEPVYLLGHSLGGMAISAAAERVPEKIRCLIYLSGFLPRNGESLVSIEARNPWPSVQPALVAARQPGTCMIRKGEELSLFFHDCEEGDQALALENLTPQPLAPMAEAINLSEERFGSVPRYYIELSRDKAICPALQRDMIQSSPCRQVFVIDSSHSPFFSKVEDLGTILWRIVKAESSREQA